MKGFTLLPLAALGAAFVLPDQQVMSSLAFENTEPAFEVDEQSSRPLEAWHEVQDAVFELGGCAKHHLDQALDFVSEEVSEFGKTFDEAFDHQSWLQSAEDAIEDLSQLARPPRRPPHKKPGHKKPGHHGPFNLTVFELISKSKYTTVLAKLISEYDDLVELLNGTAANYTVFAPTDKAFKKIPKGAPKPSKEFLKKLLTYHVSSDFYPAGRLLVTRTLPSLLSVPELGDEPQRLSTQITLKGPTINFYSHIRAIDVFGTNGVIHAIDSILVPPPKAIDIIQLLPGEFSTLQLAILKSGLGEKINDTSLHTGGTIFAPTNRAFKFLGPRINAFLFSPPGQKYLKALIEYHLVADFTLYSDAFYDGSGSDTIGEEEYEVDVQSGHRIPKGRYHVDLPTVLGKSLAIDIARFGRLIEIKINGYNRVAIPDGVAKDGVIHVVNSVLIPPKKPGAFAEPAESELTVEDLMERLEPYAHEEGSNMPFSFEL